MLLIPVITEIQYFYLSYIALHKLLTLCTFNQTRRKEGKKEERKKRKEKEATTTKRVFTNGEKKRKANQESKQ